MEDHELTDVAAEEQQGAEAASNELLLPTPGLADAEKASIGRRVIESLAWLALVMAFSFAGDRSPFFSLIGFFVFPVPVVIMVMRTGVKISLLCFAVILAVTSFLFSLQTSVQIFLQYGVLGLLMGYNIRRGLPQRITFISSAVIAAIGIFTSLFLRLSAAGYSLATLPQAMQASLEEYISLAGSQGYDMTAAPMINVGALAADVLNSGLRILPAAIILAALAVSGLCFLLSRVFLKRLRYNLPEWKPFKQWHFPRLLAVIGLICGIILLYWQDSASAFYVGGLNVFYMLLPVVFIAGISMLSWLFSLWTVKRWLKVLLVVVAVIWFWRVALISVMVCGSLDMLLNIRQFYYRRIGTAA